jgi:hypothetical protein
LGLFVLKRIHMRSPFFMRWCAVNPS